MIRRPSPTLLLHRSQLKESTYSNRPSRPQGLDSYYGTHGSRLVPVECASGGGKVTFQFDAIANNNGTSVEDGQIPEIIFYV